MSKASDKISHILTGISTSIVLFFGHSMPVYGEEDVEELNPISEGANLAHGTGMPEEIPTPDGSLIDITNFILRAIGLIAVVMLVFGGFRYIISSGNNEKVKAAKNTVIYAIIGLIIVIFAYAIVNFVINKTTN